MEAVFMFIPRRTPRRIPYRLISGVQIVDDHLRGVPEMNYIQSTKAGELTEHFRGVTHGYNCSLSGDELVVPVNNISAHFNAAEDFAGSILKRIKRVQ
jgi:hypothetical protein